MFDPFERAVLGDDEGELEDEFFQVRARMQRKGFGNIGLITALPRLPGAQFGTRSEANLNLSRANRRQAFAVAVSRPDSKFEEWDKRFARVRAGGGSGVELGSKSTMSGGNGRPGSGFAFGGNFTPLTRVTALAGGAQVCVVKLVSTGGGRRAAGAMIAYNSRDGKEPVERESGELVLSREDVSKMLDEWEGFFDKREPSKDVMTLTVTFEGVLSDSQRKAFKAAVEGAYKDQRLVSGFGLDNKEHDIFKAVVSIASKEAGRIKTTYHARDMLEASVKSAQELGTPKGTFALSNAAHGVDGLESHLKRALQTVPNLSGPKDKLIDDKAVSRDAAKWRADLRSYGNRDVMHLVISSKAGTDEMAFVNAARDFLGSEFGNHKYAFALHGPNDDAVDKKSGESKATDHVHVHAMIVMKGIDGKKLNPRIQDFKNWRESMAGHARAHGINMVATSRTETLNAVNFSKNEHELVRSGRAPKNIVEKIANKQVGKAALPTQPSGIVNAQIGKTVFTQLVANSRKDGKDLVTRAAARMIKRFDDLFKTIDVKTAALKQDGGLAALIDAIQDVSNMLNSKVKIDSGKDGDMASKAAVEAAVERLAKTGAAISESLRGDPALKQAFDSKMMIQVTALKSLGDKSKTSQDMSEAVRSRTLQAQVVENAQALERQARAAGEGNVGYEKASDARGNRAVAARVGGSAASAEMSLRAGGADAQSPLGVAKQVVASDSILPYIERAEEKPQPKAQERGANAKPIEKPRGRSK